jgi:hypothetical protein
MVSLLNPVGGDGATGALSGRRGYLLAGVFGYGAQPCEGSLANTQLPAPTVVGHGRTAFPLHNGYSSSIS